MGAYVLAIDQGTTSSRAIVFDAQLNVLGIGQQEFPQHFPAPVGLSMIPKISGEPFLRHVDLRFPGLR
jgi:glycerol kinase